MDDRPPSAMGPPGEPRTRIGGPGHAAQNADTRSLVPRDLQPTAHGTLAATPVAHVLVYMLDHTASGSVTLHEPDGWEHLIYVHEGAAAMVKTERPIALLGNELVTRRVIDREMVARSVEAARSAGVLLGRHLVDSGAVSAGDLEAALHAQVVHKVAGIANLPDGTRYAYYPDHNFLGDWADGELYPSDPLSTIHECVRGWMDRARILGTLGRIGSQPLVLHAQSACSTLALSAEEQAVFDVIASEGAALPDLLDRRLADVEVVRSLVYLLAITRQFEFSSARGAPMRGGKRKRPPQPRRQTPSFSGVSEIAPRGGAPAPPVPVERPTFPDPPAAQAAGAQDGEEEVDVAVDVDVPTDDDPGGAPVDDEAAGWQQEPDAEDAPYGDPGRELSPAERLLQAMNDFRLAQDALQRGETVVAEQYAVRAVEGDPEQVDHVALLAWIRAKDGDAETVEESLARLTDVLAQEPDSVRALLYRARLYKRTGQLSEALADYEAVLQSNPRHREASAEVSSLRR